LTIDTAASLEFDDFAAVFLLMEKMKATAL